jgi:hypothetical protein
MGNLKNQRQSRRMSSLSMLNFLNQNSQISSNYERRKSLFKQVSVDHQDNQS